MAPRVLGQELLGMRECGFADRERGRDRSVFAQCDDERARVDAEQRRNALLFEPRA